MEPFNTLKGVAAHLPIMNVDTDMIIPKQFLKTIKRTGLGKHLFDEMRFLEDGSENPAFILNQSIYRETKILLSGINFGCGSSREHAPWSLLDFGIRCIIAPSYADIFYNNCFKNGILPIVLSQQAIDQILQSLNDSSDYQLTIDLKDQHVLHASRQWHYDIEPFRKECLLSGLDDIALTLKRISLIDAYEASMHSETPWLF